VEIKNHKGRIDLGDYFEQCRDFHGFMGPGLVLGGMMVDWALEAMEPSQIFNAVVETRKCLPDAVQILTKCSIGNGWLKILDWGKLAITIYDINTLMGARVHLDYEKVARYPLVKAWALKEKLKTENPLEPLIEEMIKGGRGMLTCRKGLIGSIPEKLVPYDQPRLCSNCGEAFRYGSDNICQGCLEPFFQGSVISIQPTQPSETENGHCQHSIVIRKSG